MKRLAVGLLLAVGCEPSPPAPAQSPRPSADAPREPASEPVPPKAPEAANNAAAPARAPLCERMCALQGQARAVGAEVIARECAERCAAPAPQTCADVAKQARARVEKAPMPDRASKVWAEISKAEFYCGYTDPLIRGLAAAATDDAEARARALTAALEADPFAADTCPPRAAAGAGRTATDAIEDCALKVPHEAWHDDVDAATFLASRAVRLRLEAAGLYADDRKILLDTLVLSTALSRGG